MKYIIDVPDNTIWIQVPTDRLEPYTEPDRKAIEDEVWNFHKEIMFRSEYEGGIEDSYQEAKTKYDAWKKKEDEIRVGDEVIPLDTQYDTMVVTRLWTGEDRDEWVDAIASDGKLFGFLKTSIKKTGRHFDEVEELLKKMKED